MNRFRESLQGIASGRLLCPFASARKRWELWLKGAARCARQKVGLKKPAQRGGLAMDDAHDGTIRCKLFAWLDRPSAHLIIWSYFDAGTYLASLASRLGM
jgi:hypothetical protein